MKPPDDITDDLLIARAEEFEAVFRKAVREALRFHRRLGNPIAAWKDGRVVLIPPEEIPVDDPLEEENPTQAGAKPGVS